MFIYYTSVLSGSNNNVRKKVIYKPLSKCSENGIYHGCWWLYEDGTRKMINEGRSCHFATNDPFWKEPKDVDFKVKTRSQKERTPTANQKDVLKYLTVEINENENPIGTKVIETDKDFMTAW